MAAAKTKPNSAKTLALHCAKIADAQKGRDIVVADIRDVSTIADYFVFASGGSAKQVQAMAEEIDARNEKDLGQRVFHVQGMSEGRWVVLDYVDVVVHLFIEEARKYYNLDRLWGDAKIVAARFIGQGDKCPINRAATKTGKT